MTKVIDMIINKLQVLNLDYASEDEHYITSKNILQALSELIKNPNFTLDDSQITSSEIINVSLDDKDKFLLMIKLTLNEDFSEAADYFFLTINKNHFHLVNFRRGLDHNENLDENIFGYLIHSANSYFDVMFNHLKELHYLYINEIRFTIDNLSIEDIQKFTSQYDNFKKSSADLVDWSDIGSLDDFKSLTYYNDDNDFEFDLAHSKNKHIISYVHDENSDYIGIRIDLQNGQAYIIELLANRMIIFNDKVLKITSDELYEIVINDILHCLLANSHKSMVKRHLVNILEFLKL